jgi:hypothetical protein
MPALSALAVVLFVALLAADLRSVRGGRSNSSASRVADSAAPAMQSRPQALPASPGAADEADAGAAAIGAATAERFSAPATQRAAGDGAKSIGPAPGTATAPSENALPGTSGSTSTSTTQAAPTAAPTEAVQAFRNSGPQGVSPDGGAGNDGPGGLRIAEVITALVALATGGTAGVRWIWQREVDS